MAFDCRITVGVMAPGSPIARPVADRVLDLAATHFPDGALKILFHPQCFSACGYFAGPDAERVEACLEIANDPRFDALWFARGGYGACRIVEAVLAGLAEEARRKRYMGYSDAGVLLAALYGRGFTRVAHGPMPGDVARVDGGDAIRRALGWLAHGDPVSLEAGIGGDVPTAAFNMATLSHILGTPLQPDLGGHVLILEEVAEPLYRIDRMLFHITANSGVRRCAGIRLGRCSDIPANTPDFVLSPEEIVQHWCRQSRIPYLGRADIGHDSHNKIVPFGRREDR